MFKKLSCSLLVNFKLGQNSINNNNNYNNNENK